MAINIGENTGGDVTYQNPPVNRTLFPNIKYGATPEEIQEAVDAWLDEHPEATTTVEDGSILPVKLDSTNDATDGYVLSYNATAEKFEWYDICGELDEINSDISDLKQDLQEFPNGNYPNMTAGNADQLVSTVFIEDEVPYNFRTSGGSADIGDREYDEIVGVSMPVNQMARPIDSTDNWKANNSTLTFADGVATFTATARYGGMIPSSNSERPTVIAGHRYYFGGECKKYSASADVAFGVNYGGAQYYYGSDATTNWTGVYKIGTCVTSGLGQITAQDNEQGDWGQVQVRNIVFIDLTLLLGTAIVDYVYSLETATAGAGVTWLRHHFPKIFDSGYIPYNAGEMQSVSGLSVHRMTGFNQWDEVWEVGGVNDNTGVDWATNDRIRSKNYIPVLPNTVYYIKASSTIGTLAFYDADKNFISAMTSISANYTRTTPANAWYIRFNMPTSYGTTYKNDICINLHWDGERDGEYEAYKEYEYALDDSVVLRGKLELDSNNNLRANGDRYLPDGTLDRRWRETNMADLTWNYDPSGYRWQTTTLSTVIKNYPSRSANLVSDKWVADISAANGDNGKMFTGSGYVFCYSTDSVNKPTGTLLFELATPTTETAEPYQSPQIVDDWGTEEYVSTSLVPVGHDTKYANNLRAKLEMSPDSPEENGDYIVRHSNGENEYVALGSTTTIQNILDRLTALENA